MAVTPSFADLHTCLQSAQCRLLVYYVNEGVEFLRVVVFQGTALV